jgi:hypothetical protein
MKITVPFTDLSKEEQVACCFGPCVEHKGKLYRMVEESKEGVPSVWEVEWKVEEASNE